VSTRILKLSAVFATAILLVITASIYLSGRYLDRHYEFMVDGETGEAIVAAERASRLDPLSAEALLAKSSLLQSEERYRQAERALEAAAEREPANYELPQQLGDIRLNSMNRPSEAVDSYERVLELNPRSTDARLGLAEAYVRTGELRQAVVQYEKLDSLEGLDSGQLYELGRLYTRTGEPEKGLAAIRRARDRAQRRVRGLEGRQRQRRLGFLRSFRLAIAEALVVERRYEEAYRVVSNTPTERSAARLDLISSDPEGYRLNLLNSRD